MQFFNFIVFFVLVMYRCSSSDVSHRTSRNCTDPSFSRSATFGNILKQRAFFTWNFCSPCNFTHTASSVNLTVLYLKAYWVLYVNGASETGLSSLHPSLLETHLFESCNIVIFLAVFLLHNIKPLFIVLRE